MFVELKELSEALYIMRNKYLNNTMSATVKDIDSFIEAMGKVIKGSEFLLSDSFSDNLVTILNMDKETDVISKDKLLEMRKNVIIYTKTIMDFIDEWDRNKHFLDGYIKHIGRYFLSINGNKINNHPFLMSQHLAKMFMEPFIADRDDYLIAMHYYYDDIPCSDNQFNEIFSIDFVMGIFTPYDAIVIPSHKILELEYAGAVTNGVKEAIISYLDYAIKKDITVYESDNCYTLTHQLDDDFSLNLFLLKEYFRLKR